MPNQEHGIYLGDFAPAFRAYVKRGGTPAGEWVLLLFHGLPHVVACDLLIRSASGTSLNARFSGTSSALVALVSARPMDADMQPEMQKVIERGATPRESRLVADRIVTTVLGVSPLVATAAIVAGLAASWFITRGAGGVDRLPPHVFYLPIIFAAVRFGAWGAVAAGIAAGLLAGPALPLVVDEGLGQAPAYWAARTIAFVGLGALIAVLTGRIQRTFQREVELARQEAEIAARSAAIIQTVSHELRTPLTIISGTARTLEERGMVKEAGRPLLESLTSANRRLSALVETVLAVAEPPAQGRRMTHTRVGVGEVVERAMAGALVGETLGRLSVRGLDAQTVETEPEVLVRILEVLLDNAIRFSPPGTPIEVRAERLPGAVAIVARDHGPGIDPSFIDRAFDPFTQADQSTTRRIGGLGLGLFVARTLTHRLGGEIHIRRPDGGGAEVRITLPQRRAGDLPREAPASPQDPSSS